MDTENIGFLLHKLTKYQTLQSNSYSNEKRSVYQQKINQYMNKLEACGADKATLNQIGGLAGAIPESLTELIEIQKRRIKEKIDGLKTKTPTTLSTEETALLEQLQGLTGTKVSTDASGNIIKDTTTGNPTLIPTGSDGKLTTYLNQVTKLQTNINETKNNYKITIGALVGLIRQLLKSLIELEKELLGLDISPAGFASVKQLQALLTELESKLTAPPGIDAVTQDEIQKIIVDTYFESLVNDMNTNPNNFYIAESGTVKHNNQLSVDMRQLARLMGYKPELGTIKFNTTDVTGDDFIKNLFGKFIDTNNTAAVSVKKDGKNLLTNDNVVKALKELSSGFADKFIVDGANYDLTKTGKN